jgi:glycosidase
MTSLSDRTRAFYQIWSLSFNANELAGWSDFIKDQGYTSVYFTPLFKSDNHGYDTNDYFCIDPRFGTNEEFKNLISKYHESGLEVFVDGVFNHVGRGFWAFQDVLQKREDSEYINWFKGINFSPDAANEQDKSFTYFPSDGLSYQGWEGNYDLVELNHDNPDLVNHLISAAKFWTSRQDDGGLGIDGIRLDVAYSLPSHFLSQLHSETGVPMIGEQIHGDYTRILSTGIDSVTDYNLFKALWSSVLEKNLFELEWTLKKHQEEYSGANLLTFLDNHDVPRIGSRYSSVSKSDLSDQQQAQGQLTDLELAYVLLFTVPGTPCIYYGSEIPETADKVDGLADSDVAIRPRLHLSALEDGVTRQFISNLIGLKLGTPDLHGFDLEIIEIKNEQILFRRGSSIIGVNLSDNYFEAQVPDFGQFGIGARNYRIETL